jgi:polar amino acid transport system substrate-binding protein
LSVGRFIACLLACLLAAATLANAQSPQIPVFWNDREQLTKPNIAGLERVRFLTTTNFQPFNFLDGSGRLTGFHIDLARAICHELEIAERCQIQALPWPELEPALAAEQGEAIIAGLSITPATRSKYAFTRPYMRFPARFVALRSAEHKEPLHAALRGKRVGVIAGSAHETMLRNYFPDLQPVTYTRTDWMLADLRSSKVEALFGDGMRLGFWLAEPQGAECCKFIGGPYLGPEYLGQGLAIAVRSEDDDLAQAFDFALREIGVQGIFAELYLRYFPVGFF